MNQESFKESKAYQYVVDVLEGKFPTNKYIKAICKKFLYEIDHQEELLYYFDYEIADKIIGIMKLINFATGAVVGQSLYEACVGYQYFFILNIFCWKRKDKPEKRRYEVCLLWLARKNSKSCGSGIVMIILMLLELKYSEFYLCANTRDQAKIVYGETRKLIESSPFIKDKFDIKRDVITCKLNQNTLKALSSDWNTTDGLRVSAACIDEVGAARWKGDGMTNKYKEVERMLVDYPNLKVKVDKLKIELEQAQEIVDIRGPSDNEKAGSSTNAFSSVVEDEVLQRIRTLEKTVQTILRQMIWREREIRKVENALGRLSDDEKYLIELRYFKGLSINTCCDILLITSATFNRKRKKIIENKLIPLL